jgi:hypothetical protein
MFGMKYLLLSIYQFVKKKPWGQNWPGAIDFHYMLIVITKKSFFQKPKSINILTQVSDSGPS